MLAKLRSRLSYANVVATLALFVALGGSSYATISISGKNVKNSSLTGRDVRNNSITGADVKRIKSGDVADRSLLATDFKTGQLPAGPTGDTGPPGADGARGAAIISGQATGLTPVTSGGSLRRASPYGLSTASTFPTDVGSLSPDRPIIARDLSARVPIDTPAGGSTEVDFVANPDGTNGDPLVGRVEFGCTIVDTGSANDKTCTAPGPISIPPGALLFVRITVSAGATTNNPGKAFWGITVEPG